MMSFRIQSPLPEGTESSQFPSSPLPDSVGRCLSLSRRQGHIEKAFHALNVLRSDSLLCDVTLAVGSVRLPAHRVVLAACSSYFHAMFTGDLLEARESTVTLKGIEGSALQALVNFMYTTDISINEDNVQSLLPAAQILQLDEVQEACSAFLQAQLHPSNALGIRSFADMHNCRDLLIQAQSYIDQHFEEVCQCDEFLSLTANQVCRLISSDNIIVTSEEQTFEAAVRWTNHDLVKRRSQFATLIESVRLPLIAQDYLVNIGEEQLIKSNSQCKDLLIEAMRYHLMKDEQRSSFRSPRVKPRIPVGSPKALLVFGGQAPKAIRSVEQYDFLQDMWTPMVDMPSRRCRCGTAVLDGLVYAVGGFNGSLRVRTVECFDPVKSAWSQVTNMEARRSTLGTGVLNGLIFAVGGFDGTLGLNTVEFYEPETREWHTVACMSTRRSSVGVGVLNGLLYAVGGYDGVSRQCLSTIESYNPVTNVWQPAPDMSVRRSGAAVGVLDGLMYAVGGHDGPLIRSTVEVFSAQTGTWRPAATMNVCRRNAGVVSHNGLLYVLGGDDGTSSLNSVECYDPRIDKWTMMSRTMVVGRSYAGVCVVDKAR